MLYELLSLPYLGCLPSVVASLSETVSPCTDSRWLVYVLPASTSVPSWNSGVPPTSWLPPWLMQARSHTQLSVVSVGSQGAVEDAGWIRKENNSWSLHSSLPCH